MARKKRIKSKGATAVMFQKTTGSRKVWVKAYKSRSSAARAIKGVVKKTSNKLVSTRSAKGYKFGSVVKRINRSK